jgi:hypothetical protein
MTFEDNGIDIIAMILDYYNRMNRAQSRDIENKNNNNRRIFSRVGGTLSLKTLEENEIKKQSLK